MSRSPSTEYLIVIVVVSTIMLKGMALLLKKSPMFFAPGSSTVGYPSLYAFVQSCRSLKVASFGGLAASSITVTKNSTPFGCHVA